MDQIQVKLKNKTKHSDTKASEMVLVQQATTNSTADKTKNNYGQTMKANIRSLDKAVHKKSLFFLHFFSSTVLLARLHMLGNLETE